MDITPTPEFQQAFRTVMKAEPTPANVINCIRNQPELYRKVEEEVTRIRFHLRETSTGC